VAPPRDLSPLFNPRSLAIVGASATPAKWGYWLARSALEGAKRRKVYLVNRDGKTIFGHRAHRALTELPSPVDLVVIAIPASGFLKAVDDALAAGARAIVAITAGLGELGADGAAVEREAVERVRRAGAILVGPNCLGVVDSGTELNLASSDFAAGSIGLISQSGNLALELALIAADAGVGFSRFVSVGNQADVGVADLIQAYVEHRETRVIAIYAEDFRDGRALARAALQAAESGKPVILLTVGTSQAGARAARSHTGAMVSASAAVDAACRASGMLRVKTPRQLIELAQGLLMPHSVHGRRVGVVGDGGGHVALAADLVTESGLELPLLKDELAVRIGASLPAGAATRNPIDLAGGGEQDFLNYERVVRALATSGEVDIILLTGYFGGYSLESEEFAERETKVAVGMAEAAAAGARPLIVHTMYPQTPSIKALSSRGVPVYSDIGAAVRVVERLARRLGRPFAGVPALTPVAQPVPVAEGYFEARDLVATAGVSFPEARRVETLAEAQNAAASLGFPVVLKALGHTHKSDVGGVRLGIAGAGELKSAFADMHARLNPPAYSLERMAPAGRGVELIVGVVRDRSFGPVVMIGLGGVYAELLDDAAVALAPLSKDSAEALIRSLKGAGLLDGARGLPVLDAGAAAAAASALSRIAVEHPDIAEIEINPLLVGPEGALALDARVIR
jgi:acetate---CoA ligase (ADP-forming)